MRATGNSRGDLEEKQLIARCKQGDRAAINDLIIRYERKVYNFAYRLCGHAEDASDIASEAFVRVFNSISHFRGDASFITWLFRIVTNVYLDERKRRRSRPQQSLDELIDLEDTSVTLQIEDSHPSPEENAELSERSRLLSGAIDNLPEYQKMMVVMYHSEGLSYEEIAAALDMPIGTVKSRLNRARLALRELLCSHPEHFPT